MTSTAISAQGSVFNIGTGSGSAVAVSGVAVGNPTVITATAHGFNNGDRITFDAGFTGTNASVLNGQTFSVQYKTTNTFAIAIDTTGDTITAGTAHATPTTWTAVANCRTLNGLDGAAAEIDRTNLASTAKEFILGLMDPGHMSFECDYDLTDPGQIALFSHQQSGALAQFKMVLPNADTFSFAGYVKKYAQTAGVDQVIKRSVEIRITGPITKTP